jgi:hypothetical protein
MGVRIARDRVTFLVGTDERIRGIAYGFWTCVQVQWPASKTNGENWNGIGDQVVDRRMLAQQAGLFSRTGMASIEESCFPFEHLSEIAELESWRKEINRPIYHIHKWWAQRLGSVFRAILISAFSPPGTDILAEFYEKRPPSNKVVLDPFMGSGTTIGEAVKLGIRVIGQDINPVSHFLVKNALAAHDRQEIVQEFEAMEADTAPKLRRFYQARIGTDLFPDGLEADVLYYFWVKVLTCPECGHGVDLFNRYIFCQHAYPAKYPSSKAVCPHCGAVNTVNFDAEKCSCAECRAVFDPQVGPAQGQTGCCPRCKKSFPIAKTVRATRTPPRHRRYAKMVLLPGGEKQYQRITPADLALYDEAEVQLQRKQDAIPVVAIEPGHNTNQALGYNYTHWHLMFNARQLLCLSILADRIRQIEEPRTRDLFACLLSGCLEFNNMFASFKGEGTGAVRHMFAHHILKPERTPLEANPWGTPRSSGSFSTLFASRILRALGYQEQPFEVRPVRVNGRIAGEKVVNTSHPIEVDVAERYAEFSNGKRAYLTCGNSSKTDLPDKSVDAVVTDPLSSTTCITRSLPTSSTSGSGTSWVKKGCVLAQRPGPPMRFSRANRTPSSRGLKRCGGNATECCGTTGS